MCTITVLHKRIDEYLLCPNCDLYYRPVLLSQVLLNTVLLNNYMIIFISHGFITFPVVCDDTCTKLSNHFKILIYIIMYYYYVLLGIVRNLCGSMFNAIL